MITLNTKEASKTITNVVRAVPRKIEHPISQCVKLFMDEGLLRMMAFNINDGIIISDGLDIVGGDDMPPVAVDASKLNQVFQSAIGDTATLRVKGNMLHFKSGTMSARLATQDADMFVNRVENGEHIYTLPSKDLSRTARSLMFLSDNIDYPGNYSGAFLISKYFLTTNNSYAVGRRLISNDIVGEYWLPAYGINHVVRSASGDVEIYKTPYGLKFLCGNLDIDISLVDNSGADFGKAFLAIRETEFTVVNRSKFSDMLSAALVFAIDFSKYASIEMADNKIAVCVGGDVFSASVAAETVSNVTFGVNCEALSEIVSKISGGDIQIGVYQGRMIYVTAGDSEYALAGMKLREPA